MYSLKDGAPRKIKYATTVKKEILEQLQEKYKSKKLSVEKLFWAYYEHIVERLITNLPDQPFETIWKKLTKPQKTILSLGQFITQTNNGGVWQFFFNRPLYALAVAESFYEIHMFEYDFECLFNEFVKMANQGIYTQIMDQWNDESLTEEERWTAFKSGAKHIPSIEEFEKNFFKKTYNKRLYTKLKNYIEMHMGKLVEVLTEEERVIIKKKDAIPYFTNYLTNAYGEAPSSVEVYYTGRVTVDNEATQLFLMRFAMPDGYESIGITGYFSYHFTDVPITTIKRMYQKYHKQELVNIYHGRYLVDKILAKNPKAMKVDPEKWETLVKKLQLPKNSQIPVNVELLQYFKNGKEQIYIYKGDLLYNDKTEHFPTDMTAVTIDRVGKTGPLFGEINLIFHTVDARKPGFGRRSDTEALTSQYPLYSLMGAGSNKLLKDNPWGF